MFPSIPDKYYKLLILVGVVLIGFSYYTIRENENKYNEKINTYNNMYDELTLKEIELEEEKKKLIQYDIEISMKYQVEKSINTSKKGEIIFSSYIAGNKNDLIASKLMSNKFEIYSSKAFDYKILNKKYENYYKYLESEEKLKIKAEDELTDFLFGGFVLLLIGFYIWTTEEYMPSNKNAFNINKKIQDRIYNYCQSCGMKFSSSRFYGTNKDETYNNAFCEDCYCNGEFTEPELTFEQVKERAKPFMGSFIIKSYREKCLNELERFNRNKYFD